MDSKIIRSDFKQKRNSSIELLRILAMLGVIILHYNNAQAGGGFKYVSSGSLNQYYLYFTESLFVCAVNLFVMISAYFLCSTTKRDMTKVLKLIAQVILFNYIFYIIKIIEGEASFSVMSVVGCLFPVNYFVVLYSVLYIISPYINRVVDVLDKNQLRIFVVTMFSLFSVWPFGVDVMESLYGAPLNGLSTIGMMGSQYGYTIVNFVLSYIVAAYIRKSGLKMSRTKNIIIVVALLIAIYGMSIFELLIGHESSVAWNYDNPLVILIAAGILMLFYSLHFESKIINTLAKSAFTCYLLHGFIVSRVNVENIVNEKIYILVCHQIIVAVVIYVASFIVFSFMAFLETLFKVKQ